MNKSNMSWQNAGKVVSRQTQDSMREIVHAMQFLAVCASAAFFSLAVLQNEQIQ